MQVDANVLRKRTKQFALRVIPMTQQLPRTRETDVIARQLLRSATSMAADYRAACRGRSHADFFSKLCVVVEEADETLFWIELLVESGIVLEAKMRELVQEASELTAIFTSSRSTAGKHTLPSHQVINSPN